MVPNAEIMGKRPEAVWQGLKKWARHPASVSDIHCVLIPNIHKEHAVEFASVELDIVISEVYKSEVDPNGRPRLKWALNGTQSGRHNGRRIGNVLRDNAD